jgi:hypothetical protein
MRFCALSGNRSGVIGSRRSTPSLAVAPAVRKKISKINAIRLSAMIKTPPSSALSGFPCKDRFHHALAKRSSKRMPTFTLRVDHYNAATDRIELSGAY